MLLNPNKKTISVIMERLKPSVEKAGDDPMAKYDSTDGKDEPLDGCLECAQAMLDAIKNNDAKMLKEALSDFLELHKSEPEAESQEESMSEESKG